jgi:hypothetical protein
VIIGYTGVLTVIETTEFTNNPHLVVLAWCNNMSAMHWVSHTCLKSKEGCALGHLFSAILINSRLGINAKWLSMIDNIIADEISGI